jgi:hypothetical protein
MSLEIKSSIDTIRASANLASDAVRLILTQLHIDLAEMQKLSNKKKADENIRKVMEMLTQVRQKLASGDTAGARELMLDLVNSEEFGKLPPEAEGIKQRLLKRKEELDRLGGGQNRKPVIDPSENNDNKDFNPLDNIQKEFSKGGWVV